MNSKTDNLLIILVSIIGVGLAVTYLGMGIFKIIAIMLIILIFIHLKINPYINMISGKNQQIARKIDAFLKHLYSVFSWIKPIKLGDRLSLDVAPIVVVLVLCIFLIL